MTHEKDEIKNNSLLQLGLLTEKIHKSLEGIDLKAVAERTGLTIATVREFASGFFGNKSAIDLKKIEEALKPEE